MSTSAKGKFQESSLTLQKGEKVSFEIKVEDLQTGEAGEFVFNGDDVIVTERSFPGAPRTTYKFDWPRSIAEVNASPSDPDYVLTVFFRFAVEYQVIVTQKSNGSPVAIADFHVVSTRFGSTDGEGNITDRHPELFVFKLAANYFDA
jgi:hypothetical protein